MKLLRALRSEGPNGFRIRDPSIRRSGNPFDSKPIQSSPSRTEFEFTLFGTQVELLCITHPETRRNETCVRALFLCRGYQLRPSPSFEISRLFFRHPTWQHSRGDLLAESNQTHTQEMCIKMEMGLESSQQWVNVWRLSAIKTRINHWSL